MLMVQKATECNCLVMTTSQVIPIKKYVFYGKWKYRKVQSQFYISILFYLLFHPSWKKHYLYHTWILWKFNSCVSLSCPFTDVKYTWKICEPKPDVLWPLEVIHRPILYIKYHFYEIAVAGVLMLHVEISSSFQLNSTINQPLNGQTGGNLLNN